MGKPKQEKEAGDFFTLKEVAAKLRVNERSIFRYIHSGRLHAIKSGYWRIPKESYDKFLQENSNFQADIEKRKQRKK